jgi:hypothetical protein
MPPDKAGRQKIFIYVRPSIAWAGEGVNALKKLLNYFRFSLNANYNGGDKTQKKKFKGYFGGSCFT